MKETVRIIGGLYKGKKLHFPKLEELRPTPERVRETVFNWLMHDLPRARCLDLFAGSGALGFEAFSRGALKVVMVDSSSRVTRYLQQTASSLAVNKIKIIKSDALFYLQNNQETFDIIFLDPPFASDYLHDCLRGLTQKHLSKEGLIYVESPGLLEVDKNRFVELKAKKAGQVFYYLLKWNDASVAQ